MLLGKEYRLLQENLKTTELTSFLIYLQINCVDLGFCPMQELY